MGLDGLGEVLCIKDTVKTNAGIVCLSILCCSVIEGEVEAGEALFSLDLITVTAGAVVLVICNGEGEECLSLFDEDGSAPAHYHAVTVDHAAEKSIIIILARSAGLPAVGIGSYTGLELCIIQRAAVHILGHFLRIVIVNASLGP